MEYTFKTKQMIKVSEQVGNYYDLEKALYEGNLNILAKLVEIFGNTETEKAVDYIDEQLEQGRKVKDLYSEIFEGINNKGFFDQKLETELEVLPVDMNKMTTELYERYMNQEIENQISRTSKNM